MVTLVCYYCEFCEFVLKRPFFFFALISTVHEYMSARVCVCVFNLRMLLASSHYYCFIPSSSFSIIMKKIVFFSFVTLLLFLAAFSIASRKIQKGKVQRNVSFAYMSVWVCVLNLTSNSLEKTKQIKQIVCGGGCVGAWESAPNWP